MTVGIIMTGVGIVGIVVSVALQIVLIRVFAKQKKRVIEEQEAG